MPHPAFRLKYSHRDSLSLSVSLDCQLFLLRTRASTTTTTTAVHARDLIIPGRSLQAYCTRVNRDNCLVLSIGSYVYVVDATGTTTLMQRSCNKI
uniref:Uncharacterized protein n=1 Tax=Trichogramma kaykai TaxID=54128 RepID=A0ABD2XDG5_9HYME